MPYTISLKNVVSVVGGFPLLAGINFEASFGEIVLISGPNGAGKTSLLRLIAGLIPMTQGSGYVNGLNLQENSQEIRTLVSYVGHRPNMYDDLTALENVIISVGNSHSLSLKVKLSRVKTSKLKEEIIAAFALMGLPDRVSSTKFSRLSEGQKRRVNFIPLLIKDTKIWLLDEPHASIDALSREIIDSSILRAQERGALILIASHELEHVQAIATRTLNIQGGYITSGDQDVS